MYQPDLRPPPVGGHMIPPKCWCTCTRLCDGKSSKTVILNGNFQPGRMSRNKRWPTGRLLFIQPGSNFYLLSLSCGFRLKASTWCSDCCLWVHWPKWQRSLVLLLYSHPWIAPRPPRWQLTHYLKPIASWTSLHSNSTLTQYAFNINFNIINIILQSTPFTNMSYTGLNPWSFLTKNFYAYLNHNYFITIMIKIHLMDSLKCVYFMYFLIHSFIHSIQCHVRNATIPCHSQELLPFLFVMYFFLPPFSTNYSSILSHLILPSISWSTSQSCCSQIHV